MTGPPRSLARMHLTRSRQTDRYAMLLVLIILSVGMIAATSSRGWGRVAAIALLGATLLVVTGLWALGRLSEARTSGGRAAALPAPKESN